MEAREQLLQDLITLRDYIRWAVSRFTEEKLHFGHGTDNAWDEAVYLVLNSLHLPSDINPAVLDARLTRHERERLIGVLEQRIVERLPAPYITGESWFCGLRFEVDPRVLIPRSPIGELIQRHFEPWLARSPEHIADLCTGSGCIGIACAAFFDDARVDLVDISAEALEVAARNIEAHGLEDRVRALRSDLFDQLAPARYDLIVTNPPYVDAGDMASLPPEYRHEPSLALEAGEDGLDLVRRILRQAPDFLTEDGWLVCEVGNSEEHLLASFPEVPFIWPDFEHGEGGVFLISAAELCKHRASFEQDQ